MASTTLEIGEDLSALLAKLGQPVAETAREMIVLELYRRNLISSGKAATLLGMLASISSGNTPELRIPYFDFNEEEWQGEVDESTQTE